MPQVWGVDMWQLHTRWVASRQGGGDDSNHWWDRQPLRPGQTGSERRRLVLCVVTAVVSELGTVG